MRIRDPLADHRLAAFARPADAELPRRLPNRAGEVRSRRGLAELDAVVDAVAGYGPAGDQAPAVGRIPRQIARQLGVGRFARPFRSIEDLAVRAAPDLFAVALAPGRPRQVAEVGCCHFRAAQFD